MYTGTWLLSTWREAILIESSIEFYSSTTAILIIHVPIHIQSANRMSCHPSTRVLLSPSKISADLCASISNKHCVCRTMSQWVTSMWALAAGTLPRIFSSFKPGGPPACSILESSDSIRNVAHSCRCITIHHISVLCNYFPPMRPRSSILDSRLTKVTCPRAQSLAHACECATQIRKHSWQVNIRRKSTFICSRRCIGGVRRPSMVSCKQARHIWHRTLWFVHNTCQPRATFSL